jgi:predicted dehydrogenase
MPKGNRVRWGVLSTAKIGVDHVIPAFRKSTRAKLVAIASRDTAKARVIADELGIPTAYGSYEALLADPSIEAVYNPLPNHLHVPLTLQAVAAGKHVLCEKPVALDAAEAEKLLAIPKGMLVMEAFMVRFHPQWLKARELVRSGALGEVKAIQSAFSYFLRDPSNVRNIASIGGGGIYDIGCYPTVAGRFLFGDEPKRVVSLIERDPDMGIDRLASAILDFGGGRRVDFTIGTQMVPYQRVQVLGTSKRLEILIPFNAVAGEAMQLRLDDGSRKGEGAGELIAVEACDQYTNELDAFSQAVRGEIALPYGPEDAVRNMRILDALFRSEQSGAWEDVKPL